MADKKLINNGGKSRHLAERRMDKKLWCDLKNDKERADFIRSGRAWETGIIAKEIEKDVAEVFEFKAYFHQSDSKEN